ncbi:MAG: cytochrome c [Verrucomicrobiaceae bacterium]|nr:cytochrome c [Verrucomicrobiaceae bacterium]
MKYFFLSIIFLAVIVVSAAGFRGGKSELPPLEIFPDMDNQAKIKFQAASPFFADGVGARVPVAHTVPMGFDVPAKAAVDGGAPPKFGFSNGTDYYSTGKVGDFYGDGMPAEIEVNTALIERGQQRYDIYCAICHGASGNGKGVTSKYGILNAFNFHQPGIADPTNVTAYRADGAIFDTITNGKGLMGSYGGNIPVRDRWAIVAYIRALQTAVKDNGVKIQ